MARRMFIALDLPRVCQETLSKLDPKMKGLRWLKPEQMHLTLGFLGDVKPDAEAALHEALAQVHVPPFILPIAGVGCFGGAHPTVVWAGVGTAHPHLFALHQRVQDAALHAGLEPDLGAFHPHITMGRAKSISRTSLMPFLRRYAETEFGLWQVKDFALKSSVLSAAGAEHRVELRVPLTRPS